ncbi:MAG: sigma-70 family RNA polymerase sigma factor [Cytophagales bacterium]|nr:sigma-70 family RNA polymerase sigma factor [Cytophagales bacterium]
MDTNKSSYEEMFIELYQEAFPPVAAFVSKHGGSLDDAKDVFHEALILYYEKSRTQILVKSRQSYLYGIARYLWFQKYRQSSLLEQAQDLAHEHVEDSSSSHVSTEKLLLFLEQAGQKCMEILKAFYYDRLSMDVLSSKFGFRGKRSATVQKYKCLEKVREEVKQKNMTYEDFLE